MTEIDSSVKAPLLGIRTAITGLGFAILTSVLIENGGILGFILLYTTIIVLLYSIIGPLIKS